MIDGSQHLHHELGVQQYAVTWFPPELLLLPGEATYTQPKEETHTHTKSHEEDEYSIGQQQEKQDRG